MKALLLLMLCVSLQGYTQDAGAFNKISVAVVNPLNFSLSNAMELLNPKVINNALQLSVKINKETANVYAQINFSEVILNDMNLFSLKLSNKTSPDAIVNSDAVVLSDVPMLLFTQPASLHGSRQHFFYYDLIMNPIRNMVPPGHYQFSINFTITAQ